MKFFKLFQPFTIGTVEIQNRVIMPAMHLSAADDGYCSDQIIAFYRRRAQGKVGLIIIGGIGTSPVGQGLPTMLSLYDPKFIPKKKPFSLEFYHSVEYIQVFGNRFTRDLSIIDLIFCEGPNAEFILKNSISQPKNI